MVSDEWGIDEVTGEDFWRVTPLKTHICTAEELGLDEKSDIRPIFMPINDYYISDLNKYKEKMTCIDSADMYIHGDYNSDEARMI